MTLYNCQRIWQYTFYTNEQVLKLIKVSQLIFTYRKSALRFEEQVLLLLVLTLNPLTWRIWWASNNASKRQIGFNSAFKGFRLVSLSFGPQNVILWSCAVGQHVAAVKTVLVKSPALRAQFGGSGFNFVWNELVFSRKQSIWKSSDVLCIISTLILYQSPYLAFLFVEECRVVPDVGYVKRQSCFSQNQRAVPHMAMKGRVLKYHSFNYCFYDICSVTITDGNTMDKETVWSNAVWWGQNGKEIGCLVDCLTGEK